MDIWKFLMVQSWETLAWDPALATNSSSPGDREQKRWQSRIIRRLSIEYQWLLTAPPKRKVDMQSFLMEANIVK